MKKLFSEFMAANEFNLLEDFTDQANSTADVLVFFNLWMEKIMKLRRLSI